MQNMSAAKMVADSTQADPDPGQVKPKKRKKKIKDKKTNKKNKTQDGKKNKSKKTSEEDSDLDLEKELKAIGSFINSREEMINEMFHSLRGSTLQRHIPDVLKELTIEELKSRCLEQLEVMSKKRIRRILAGDDPANISSSGTEDESTDEEQDKDNEEEPVEGEQTVDSTSHDSGVSKVHGSGQPLEESGDELEDVEAGSEEGEIRLRLQEGSLGDEESVNSDHGEDDESRSDGEQEEGQGHEEDDQGQDFSINQMELLELEMRARAIKAMLKAQEARERQLLEEG